VTTPPQILKPVEPETAQKLDGRDIGVGSPCPRTFRAVCDETEGAQIGEHIAADLAAQQIAELPARHRLKIRDRSENQCFELGKLKRSILDAGRDADCVGVVFACAVLPSAGDRHELVRPVDQFRPDIFDQRLEGARQDWRHGVR
jgi:hypothetical protein